MSLTDAEPNLCIDSTWFFHDSLGFQGWAAPNCRSSITIFPAILFSDVDDAAINYELRQGEIYSSYLSFFYEADVESISKGDGADDDDDDPNTPKNKKGAAAVAWTPKSCEKNGGTKARAPALQEVTPRPRSDKQQSESIAAPIADA